MLMPLELVTSRHQHAGGGRGRLHTRQRADAFEQPRVKAGDIGRLSEERRRQAQGHDRDVVSLEAAVDLLHVPQRADENAGAGEQHERECHLGGDQRTPCATAAAAPTFAAAFLQMFADGRSRGLERRHQARQQRGDDRKAERKQQNAPVDRNRIRARNRAAADADEELRRPERHQQAESAADECDDKGLGDDLSNQATALRAERGPDRQLLAASRGPAEHQVAEIGAGNQEHAARPRP